MKASIYAGDEVKEDEVFLKLIPGCSGKNVILVAVDGKTGELLPQGRILSIRDDGRINRFYSVSPNLPFQLDPYGRVEIFE